MSGLGWNEECRGWSGTWGGRIREDPRGSERLGEREGGVKVELKPRTGGPRGSGEFGAFSPFRGESGRGEALSGSFLGREGPQKSTPTPGLNSSLKKHTSNPKISVQHSTFPIAS